MSSLPSNHDGLLVRQASKIGVNFSPNVGFISASVTETSLLASTASDEPASPQSSASNSPAPSPAQSPRKITNAVHQSSDESGNEQPHSTDEASSSTDTASDRRNRRKSLNLGKIMSPFISKKDKTDVDSPKPLVAPSSAPIAPKVPNLPAARPKPSGSIAIAEKQGYWIENFDDSPPPPDGEPLGQVSLFRIEDFNYHYHYHKYFFGSEHFNYTGVSDQVGPILVSICRQPTYPNGNRPTRQAPDTPTRSRTKSLSMAQVRKFMSLRSTKDLLKPKDENAEATGEPSSAAPGTPKDDSIVKSSTKPALEKSISTKKIADSPMQPASLSSSGAANSAREPDSTQAADGPADTEERSSSGSADKTVPVAEAAGEGFYRALVRFKNGDIALKIPDHALIKSLKKHSSPSAKDLMEALKEHVSSLPDIPFDFAAVHFKESSIPHQAILDMEARLMPKGYKFGVMYSKQGQTTDDEILSNNESSAAFEMFLKILGDRVDLKGFEGYNGGLDVRHGSTGAHSVYTKFKEHEVMFHVATLLPYVEGDQQQLEKKRHIGNDVVVIVFQDGDTPFEPDLIKSFFNHVFVVVRPIKPATAAATAKVSPFGMLRSRAGSTGGAALPLVRRPSAKDLEKDSSIVKSPSAATSLDSPASAPASAKEARPSAPTVIPANDGANSLHDDQPLSKEEQKRLRRTKSQGIDKSVIRRAVIMAPSLVSRPATPQGSSASDKDKMMERQLSKEKLMKKQISREQVKKEPSSEATHSSSSSRRASLEDSNESASESSTPEILLPPKKKDKDSKSKPKEKKDREHSRDKEHHKDKERKDKDSKDKDKDAKDKDKDKRLRATKRLSANKTKSLSQKDVRLFEKRKPHAFDIPSSSVPTSMSPLSVASGSDYSDNDPELADSEEAVHLPLPVSQPAPSPASSASKSKKINRKSSGKMTVTSAVASGSDNDSPNESKHKKKRSTTKRRGEGHHSSTSGSDTDPTTPASISSPRLPTITDDSDSEALLRPPQPQRLSPRDSVSEAPADLVIPPGLVSDVPSEVSLPDTVVEPQTNGAPAPQSQPSSEIVASDAAAGSGNNSETKQTSAVSTSGPDVATPSQTTEVVPAKEPSGRADDGVPEVVPETTKAVDLPVPTETVAPVAIPVPHSAPDSLSPSEFDVSAALTLLQPILPSDPVPPLSMPAPADGTDPPPTKSPTGAPGSPGESGDEASSSSSRPVSARRDTESKRGLLKKQSQFLVKQESNIKSFMRYRVEIVSKDGVVQSEQILPNPPVFHHGPYFKEFLLTKLINSERASYFAPQFAKPLERTRQILLENLFQEHAK